MQCAHAHKHAHSPVSVQFSHVHREWLVALVIPLVHTDREERPLCSDYAVRNGEQNPQSMFCTASMGTTLNLANVHVACEYCIDLDLNKSKLISFNLNQVLTFNQPFMKWGRDMFSLQRSNSFNPEPLNTLKEFSFFSGAVFPSFLTVFVLSYVAVLKLQWWLCGH